MDVLDRLRSGMEQKKVSRWFVVVWRTLSGTTQSFVWSVVEIMPRKNRGGQVTSPGAARARSRGVGREHQQRLCCCPVARGVDVVLDARRAEGIMISSSYSTRAGARVCFLCSVWSYLSKVLIGMIRQPAFHNMTSYMGRTK